MTVNGEKPDANGDLKLDLSAIDELKDRVAGLDEAVDAESRRATGAEEALSGRITDEVQARERLATDVQGNAEDIARNATAITGLGASKADKATTYTKEEVDAAVAAATPADYDSVKTRLATVEGKVPLQASAQNQLADKEFVNSSIATNTATFRGTYNLASDLGLTTGATHEQVAAAVAVKLAALSITPDHNDYCFVQVPRDDTDPTVIDRIDRYKCSVEGGVASWDYEWSLNNSSFTAVQWAAISSGITSGLVAKLDALPTAEALAAAVTLTPIYSGTPTFSAWTFSDVSDGITDIQQPVFIPSEGEPRWTVIFDYADQTRSAATFVADKNATNLAFVYADEGLNLHLTASRTRTDIIGYTLGSQVGKPLQPKGDYALLSDIAVKSVKLNGTALTPDASGAVNVPALPLTGGRMTGSLILDSATGSTTIGVIIRNSESNSAIAFSSNRIILSVGNNRYEILYPLADGTFALAAGTGHNGNLAMLDASGNPVDSGVTKSDVESLLFAQYYPDGSVKSTAEFTAGIKYYVPDTANRTITVKPFCHTRTSDDNSSLAGRVVIPPFVDASGNGYISDDGTRYKVVGVSDGESLGATSSLTAIVAPSTVTTVGQYAFMDCESLASVSFHAATVIGESAFNGCTSLTSVSLPAVTNIGGQAFNSCTSLLSVSLPAATTIGEYAFLNCTALTSVLLPAATTVGNGAFMDCSSLDSVDFGSTPRPSVPVLGQYVFSSVPASCKIIVPYMQYDAWIAANGWSDLPQEFVRHAEKADKPATFTTGHLAEFDANGNPVDGGWAVEALARYAHVTKTVDNGAATLDDLAINAVGLPSGTASATFTLPAAVPGRVRDFIVRLTLAAAASVSFSSAAGETVTWDSSGDPSGTFQAGTHLLSFTEVAPGVFRWGRPQTDLTGQTFDFSTMQGVMDALAAVVTALGGSVLNKPSAT